MNKTIILLLTLLSINVFGQNGPTDKAQPIVEEGKLLYKSEMASWYGTDLFVANYDDMENIGGYFSYSENEHAKCIFFSKAENPKVIGTITFDMTYDVDKAELNLEEREFTPRENDLFQIRQGAAMALYSNENEFFSFYQNTNPNIIPLISNNERKVYILTGPEQHGVVIFGNDYLLTFDKNNKLKSKKRLHNNLIPVEYSNPEEVDTEETIPSHFQEEGDFMTATDVCTLMLYAKFANWKTYYITTKKYLNIWNCESNTLSVIPMSTLKKIDKDQEKRKKKKK